MKNKKTIIWILIIITILQISIRIYTGNQKTYFHIDEAYSYGLMNYDKLNITDNEDFLNIWHDKSYYLDYLEINDDEKLDWKPVYENQKNDVHPPLYYFLLRCMASFTIKDFTKWTGLILNIILFCISNVFIYKISKKIFKNPIYGILACFINGFSIISINTSNYIRMYELANLATLSLTWFHLKIYEKEKISVKDLIPIFISFILGGLTHYYVLLYGLGLYIFYTFKCIKNKQKSNLLKYQITIILCAIIYLLIFPYSIGHVFFSYRGVTQVKNDVITQILGYIKIINKEFFNNLFVLLIIVVIILYKPNTKIFNAIKNKISAIKNKFKNEKQKINTSKKHIDGILIIIFSIIIYFCIVIPKAPYIEARYVMPIYSMIIISVLYLVRKTIIKNRKEKETLFILTFIYLIIIYSPLITNTKLDFTYEQYRTLVNKIQQENKPIVYVFDARENRFLDDIYLFTLVDKSIVVEKDKVEEAFRERKNLTLICQDDEIAEISEKFNFKYELLQKMNACTVYNVEFNN